MNFLLQPPVWFWRVGGCMAALVVAGSLLGVIDGRLQALANLAIGILLYASAWYGLRHGYAFGASPSSTTTSL